MDALPHLEYLLLLLDQGERLLKDLTKLFLVLANITRYPDDVLCTGFRCLCGVGSLLCVVAQQSTASARVPRPSGSTLVCRQPSYALLLHPFGLPGSS
ncbi:hypothetical protein M9458_029809, partial [Cirrhinus mrigala]